MVQFEADDALATGASRFKNQPGVEQVVVCSPDKDLAQSVSGVSVISWDRRRDIFLDRIPDCYTDNLTAIPAFPPGGPNRRQQSSRNLIISSRSLEDPRQLGLPLGRVARLVDSLRTHRQDAFLFRRLATFREDVPLEEG